MVKNHQGHVGFLFPWLVACHQVVNCGAKPKKKRSSAVPTQVASVPAEPERRFVDNGPDVEQLRKFKKVCNLQRWDFLQFATFEGPLNGIWICL